MLTCAVSIRTCAASFLLGVTSVSLAAELPVRSGILYCGDGLDLDAEGVGGEDFYCRPTTAVSPNGAVTLLCEHSEREFGPPWTEEAVIVENVVEGTVSYTDGDGSITLTPCDQ
jgi:hypothetical protein